MSRRVEALTVLALVAALALALWAGRRAAPRAPSADRRTSTLVSGPAGSRAPFDVLARLGFSVVRRRTPLLDFGSAGAPHPAMLVELNPVLPLLPAELEQVVRFVRSGGAVVTAGGGGGITRCAGWRMEREASPFLVDSIRVLPPRPGLVLPPVANVLEQGAGARAETPELGECRLLAVAGEDTLLVTRDRRPVVVRLRYPAGGSIMLWADPGYFRNRAWRVGAVPYFVAPLLAPPHPGSVVWDEYHQGFGENVSLTGATVDWLVGSPAGWASLQLLAVLLIALGVSAVRFGPARPAVERRRRSPLEHLEALAAGLEGAAGVDTAIRLIVAGLGRRLSRTGRQWAPTGGDQQWLGALELVLATPRGRAAVRQLARTASEPGGVERLLAVAQAVEDVWEELRPRTTRSAS